MAGKNPPAEVAAWTAPGMTFHGMVPDAAKFMESCHFFIVPLLSGGGMRLKIVEAMGKGRCIVSTNIGAEGIAARDGKEIMLANRPEEWIEVLGKLLKSKAVSVEIAAAAEKLAIKTYSWEGIVQQFEEFYREVRK